MTVTRTTTPPTGIHAIKETLPPNPMRWWVVGYVALVAIAVLGISTGLTAAFLPWQGALVGLAIGAVVAGLFIKWCFPAAESTTLPYMSMIFRGGRPTFVANPGFVVVMKPLETEGRRFSTPEYFLGYLVPVVTAEKPHPDPARQWEILRSYKLDLSVTVYLTWPRGHKEYQFPTFGGSNVFGHDLLMGRTFPALPFANPTPQQLRDFLQASIEAGVGHACAGMSYLEILRQREDIDREATRFVLLEGNPPYELGLPDSCFRITTSVQLPSELQQALQQEEITRLNTLATVMQERQETTIIQERTNAFIALGVGAQEAGLLATFGVKGAIPTAEGENASPQAILNALLPLSLLRTVTTQAGLATREDTVLQKEEIANLMLTREEFLDTIKALWPGLSQKVEELRGTRKRG